MSILRKVFWIFCSGIIIASFTACKKEGPAERAGKKIDKTIEKAGDKIEEAGEKARESTQK
jgi:hypothetical protein